MRMTIAAKQISGTWEGALIVEGKFRRSYTAPTLAEIVERALTPLFAYADGAEQGTSVLLDITSEAEPDAGGH